MGTGASLAHLVHEASVADLELAIAGLGVAQRERLAQILSGPEDSYSKIEGTRFEDLLRRSSMVAIKSSYFRDCLDKGEPFKDKAFYWTDDVVATSGLDISKFRGDSDSTANLHRRLKKGKHGCTSVVLAWTCIRLI